MFIPSPSLSHHHHHIIHRRRRPRQAGTKPDWMDDLTLRSPPSLSPAGAPAFPPRGSHQFTRSIGATMAAWPSPPLALVLHLVYRPHVHPCSAVAKRVHIRSEDDDDDYDNDNGRERRTTDDDPSPTLTIVSHSFLPFKESNAVVESNNSPESIGSCSSVELLHLAQSLNPIKSTLERPS